MLLPAVNRLMFDTVKQNKVPVTIVFSLVPYLFI